MAAPQQGVASLLQETILLPNLPAIAGGNVLIALTQQLAQIEQQLGNLTTAIADNHTTAQGNHALTTAALARLEAL